VEEGEHVTISNFEFRISNFRPTTHDSMREDASEMIGGAWHPDSPRIGVPGILSGSAMGEGRDEIESALLERRTGNGYGNGI
jgi:hypothetical protein